MGVLNLGNSTDSAHWQPEGNDRGTWEILRTCLITLGFCVYSSIHLNVPAHRRGKVSRFLKKSQWIFVTVLFPEVAVYTSFVQRRDAVAFLAQMREAGVWPKGPKVPWHRRVWQSMRQAFSGGSDYELVWSAAGQQHNSSSEQYDFPQAFFICMGGLAFSISEDERQIWPHGIDQMTLTPELVLWMAKEHPKLVPDIPADMVNDKSKADSFVKIVACVQAIWFIAQFVARAAQNLPVTTLELNTCVHTIYAIVAYILWWDKPMDVSEPLCLSTDKSPDIRALCARVSLCMPFRRWANEKPAVLGGEGWIPVRDRARPSMPTDSDIFRTTLYDKSHALYFADIILGPNAETDSPENHDCGPEGDEGIELSSLQLGDYPLVKEVLETVPNASFDVCDSPVVQLQRGDEIPGTRWLVCTETCEVDEPSLRRLRWADELPGGDLPAFARAPLSSALLDLEHSHFLRNWLKGKLNVWRWAKSSGPAALISTGIVYGVLHLVLVIGSELQSSFWTQAWRIACIGMIAASPVVLGGYFLTSWDVRWDGKESKLENFIGVLTGFVILFYFFARLFIIVGVVWALFYADPGVFQLPNWAVYFPHVG